MARRKRPWYKWVTTVGGAITGAGVALLNIATQLPGDLVVGTYHGAQVTAGLVSTVLGAVLTGAGVTTTAVGMGRKVEDLKPE